jgi:hypothetical protein
MNTGKNVYAQLKTMLPAYENLTSALLVTMVIIALGISPAGIIFT